MKFDLNCSHQSVILKVNALKHVYKNMYQCSQKTNWVRLTGPLIGIASGVMFIAEKIASIVENIIKGLANIFGSAFYKNCKFNVGLDQLIGNVITLIICMTPLAVISAIAEVFISTLGTLVAPKNYLHTRWCWYDPVERNNQVQQASVSK